MKYLFVSLVMLLTTAPAQSQIFGRIMDKATDKIADRIEDKIADKIAEEITKAAMKPIDKAMDDMLREKYEQDSINGDTDVDYSAFLEAYMTPVDLPESYQFDITLDAELKDYNNDKSNVLMHFSKKGNAIGIEQKEKEAMSIIVFDMENNIFAMYTKDGDKKTVQAFPSTLTSSFISASMDSINVSIEKTGKTKKILDYQTNEYKVEDESTVTKAYVAEDFPINWEDSYYSFIKHYFPATQRDQMPRGLTLKSTTKTKKKGKKSSFEVKEIVETPTVINNSDYSRVDYGAQD